MSRFRISAATILILSVFVGLAVDRSIAQTQSQTTSAGNGSSMSSTTGDETTSGTSNGDAGTTAPSTNDNNTTRPFAETDECVP